MIATEPKLADGKPFHLGMTVFLPLGGIRADGDIRQIATNSSTHEVRSFIYQGHAYNCLSRIDSPADHDIGFFYSSREAILDARIERLEREIADKSAALLRMKAERISGS